MASSNDTIKCPHCGEMNSSSVIFCTKCQTNIYWIPEKLEREVKQENSADTARKPFLTMLGALSLVVLYLHWSWRNGGGGQGMVGVVGPLSVAGAGAVLLIPVFWVSCICLVIILLQNIWPEKDTKRTPRYLPFLFAPIVIYVLYLFSTGQSLLNRANL